MLHSILLISFLGSMAEPFVFTEGRVADIIENNFFRELTELVSTCKTKDDFVKLLDKKISDLDKGEFIDGFGGDCGQKAIKKYSMQLDGAIAYIVKKKSWTLRIKN